MPHPGSLPAVTVNASPDEPDDGERRRLTPEEQETLSRVAESWRGFTMPTFDFWIPNIVDTSELAKVAAETATRLSSLALDMQGTWKRQIEFINSDFFKTHAATQAQFANLGANLTRTIEFGISDSFTRTAQQFATEQFSWLKTLGPTLELLKANFYPPNLRGIEDLEIEDVEKVVLADSIALYGVPRTAIAQALIRADSAAKRREILGRRWKAIAADCREAVERLESELVAPCVPFALAALDALDGGHTAAAQALAGSLIDSLLTGYFGAHRYRYTPDGKGKRTTDVYQEFTIRQFIAFAPMWQAYQQFRVSKGDTVPTTFNRHATAHTVSPRQFNRRNTVQALLFAASLLCFLDQQGSRRGAA